jgi:signal transduction histidine kinase
MAVPDVPGRLRPPLADRLTGGQWLAADCAAAVVAAGILLLVPGLLHGFDYHGAVVVLILAATLPLAARRIWPLPALLVVTVAVGVLMALGRSPAITDLILGLVLYTAAVRFGRTAAIAVLCGTELALAAAAAAAAAGTRGQVDAVRIMVVAGALWFIGCSVRERRRYLAGLAEQAAQRQRAEADREHQAVREERIRIARELHDVLAHSLSVVTVQAGIGRRIGAARPGEALRTLRAVEVTGRSALEELRRILGLLRDDDTEGPSLAPVPGLGDLDDLAGTVRAAGVAVALTVTGDTAQVPPAAALTVYRIVQEALTNVVKHASGANAAVLVDAGRDGVRIAVTDNGPGAGTPTSSGRHGIVGMRERAAAFGGTLDAAPLPAGGFRVTAFLPVPGLAAGQVA